MAFAAPATHAGVEDRAAIGSNVGDLSQSEFVPKSSSAPDSHACKQPQYNVQKGSRTLTKRSGRPIVKAVAAGAVLCDAYARSQYGSSPPRDNANSE
ncbi:hypothetical protein MCOR06_006352 [Pyricularia oryzae]|nr:hypothetical protein MCOR05_009722 [Pyricularia oryzae]KAI6587411.1 hypothetical protein MCOR06_006352 [Pyricularia oryzae]